MTCLGVFVTGALAQKQGTVSTLKSLVATEQAFSQAAADKGTREAFVQFIAEDGILFRPKAVNGKRWMQDHPLPPTQTSEKRALLAWQPIFAEVSEAGDLGYTTGPWEFRDHIKDVRPSGYGDFVTLMEEASRWFMEIRRRPGYLASGIQWCSEALADRRRRWKAINKAE